MEIAEGAHKGLPSTRQDSSRGCYSCVYWITLRGSLASFDPTWTVKLDFCL